MNRLQLPSTPDVFTSMMQPSWHAAKLHRLIVAVGAVQIRVNLQMMCGVQRCLPSLSKAYPHDDKLNLFALHMEKTQGQIPNEDLLGLPLKSSEDHGAEAEAMWLT